MTENTATIETEAAVETFTCEVTIPGRKSPLTFTRPVDGRPHEWRASTAKPGAKGRAAWQGFGLSWENAQGLMRMFPITRFGQYGEHMSFWVRQVITGGSPRLEVLPL